MANLTRLNLVEWFSFGISDVVDGYPSAVKDGRVRNRNLVEHHYWSPLEEDVVVAAYSSGYSIGQRMIVESKSTQPRKD